MTPGRFAGPDDAELLPFARGLPVAVDVAVAVHRYVRPVGRLHRHPVAVAQAPAVQVVDPEPAGRTALTVRHPNRAISHCRARSRIPAAIRADADSRSGQLRRDPRVPAAFGRLAVIRSGLGKGDASGGALLPLGFADVAQRLERGGVARRETGLIGHCHRQQPAPDDLRLDIAKPGAPGAEKLLGESFQLLATYLLQCRLRTGADETFLDRPEQAGLVEFLDHAAQRNEVPADGHRVGVLGQFDQPYLNIDRRDPGEIRPVLPDHFPMIGFEALAAYGPQGKLYPRLPEAGLDIEKRTLVSAVRLNLGNRVDHNLRGLRARINDRQLSRSRDRQLRDGNRHRQQNREQYAKYAVFHNQNIVEMRADTIAEPYADFAPSTSPDDGATMLKTRL